MTSALWDISRQRVPAIFLDKDGTLVVDEPYNVNPDLIRLMPEAAQGLQILAGLHCPMIVISNQSGVALGQFDASDLLAVERRLSVLFEEQGAYLAGFHFCPHHPRGTVAEYAVSCTCRKPMPGLLQKAALLHGIDLSRSWFIGAILDDIEAGSRAGCHTLLLDNGHETEWRVSLPHFYRRTPQLTAPNLREAARLIASMPDRPEPWHGHPLELA